MGYFGKQVGRPVVESKGPVPSDQPTPATPAARPRFAAKVGKALPSQKDSTGGSCPRCNGLLGEHDGYSLCGGRCGRRWVAGGPGRWLDPAALPYGVCDCCRPRLALVAADVGAICPESRVEYLILPEGLMMRKEAAPLGICRCCLPPQPLVMMSSGLVCRNKPQQRYQEGNGEVVWLGLAPVVDQASVTAAIDAVLRANHAELTLFGLFAPPEER